MNTTNQEDPVFEGEFRRLYREKYKDVFVPALQYLNLSLKTLIEKKIPQDYQMRFRVEVGRIKDENRSLYKIQNDGYGSQNLKAEDAFEKILDFVGTRITCNTIEDVYKITELITLVVSQENPNRIFHKAIEGDDWLKDYIAKPKDVGYRGVHALLKVPIPTGFVQTLFPCEVQIRTLLQNSWGELTHEDIYKPGFPPPPLVSKLSNRMASLMAVLDEMAIDIRKDIERVQKSYIQPVQDNECDKYKNSEAIIPEATNPPGEIPQSDVEPGIQKATPDISEYIRHLEALIEKPINLTQDQIGNLLTRLRQTEIGNSQDLFNNLKVAVELNRKLGEYTDRVYNNFGLLTWGLQFSNPNEKANLAFEEEIERAKKYKRLYSPGIELYGSIVHVSSDYALVQLTEGDTGIIHASALRKSPSEYVNVFQYFMVGDTVKVKVKKSDYENERIEFELCEART